MGQAAAQEVKPERIPKGVSRLHRGNLGPAATDINRIFQHVKYVAEVAAMVSRQTGITDTHTIDTMIYKHVRDPTILADVTQAAISDGVTAMKAARTMGKDNVEPEFKTGAIKLNNRHWHLNPVAGGYLATGNMGGETCVAISVPKKVGDRISRYRMAYLTVTPEKYSISYTNSVEPMPERDPSLGAKHHIPELTYGVDRVAAKPRNVVGVDINSTNATATSGSDTFQMVFEKEVNRVVEAKTRQMEATARDHAKWEAKKGRPISHTKEDAKKKRDKVLHGGTKKYNKRKRDLRGAERRCVEQKDEITRQEKASLVEPRKEWRAMVRAAKGDAERQAEVKAEREAATKAVKAETRRLKKEVDEACKQEKGIIKREMKRCIVPQNEKKKDASPLERQKANDSKMRGVGRASRNLENTLHLFSLFIVSWAAATGSVVALEDLRNMAAGWMRQNKRFGRGMRRRLYSSAMLKLSDMIYYKARWAGVWVVYVNPHDTSKLCSTCRHVLEGKDYHFRYCRRCNVCVNRDVNASHNVRRTSAAAMFGALVQALTRAPEEAMRFSAKKLCYGDLVTDGVTIMADGEIVWDVGGEDCHQPTLQ